LKLMLGQNLFSDLGFLGRKSIIPDLKNYCPAPLYPKRSNLPVYRSPLAVLSLIVAFGFGLGFPPSSHSAELRSLTANEILTHIRAEGKPLTLLNIWATWCGPCKEELPDLLKLKKNYQAQGLHLVLVSADVKSKKSEAEAFLKSLGVDFLSFFKGERDLSFIEGLNPKWQGAIPASVLYDSKGNILDSWHGSKTYKEFEVVIKGHLTPKKITPIKKSES